MGISRREGIQGSCFWIHPNLSIRILKTAQDFIQNNTNKLLLIIILPNSGLLKTNIQGKSNQISA